MGHFLGVALGFPMAIYSGLLALAIVYWLFVLVGAVHVSFDGADGAVDGAMEGATKGALDGAVDAVDLDLDVGGASEVDLDVHGDGGHAGLLNALKLRSAPATLVLSLIVFFAWILGMFGAAAIDAFGLGIAAKLALFVLAPVVGVFPTSVVIRPLARTLKPVQATKRAQLVGKLCTIRTGTVTDRFGEALLEDGGSGLVVRVRVDAGEKLGRGDQALIVSYDEESQEFTVAPLPEVER
ncbi:MAG: DUF1449 family protein [Labilithrix sp.]|nr:DUF1449 family protein [Labilithrix sp.]MCW5815263.1 DUF1449 family protein [Labilithrix sp.]